MLIGIISDTHIGRASNKLPRQVFETFENVDLILHAGDLTEISVIEELSEIAPVKAVRGADDDLNLPESEVIEVDGIRIGLNHGIVHPKGDKDQLAYLAHDMGVRILVTGYTHSPKIETAGDVLLICPGSPTEPNLSKPTVILLEIENGNVEVEPVVVAPPTCSVFTFEPPNGE